MLHNSRLRRRTKMAMGSGNKPAVPYTPEPASLAFAQPYCTGQGKTNGGKICYNTVARLSLLLTGLFLEWR